MGNNKPIIKPVSNILAFVGFTVALPTIGGYKILVFTVTDALAMAASSLFCKRVRRALWLHKAVACFLF